MSVLFKFDGGVESVLLNGLWCKCGHMRLLVRLTAERDSVYDSHYQHKLRGVLWNRLKDSRFQSLHGDGGRVSFCYSNPFPVGDISEGDSRCVLVSSPHNGLVEKLHESISEGEEFNIGEMPFAVSDSSVLSVDVGEPGTSGTIRTDTGVYVPLPEERWGEYGLNPEYNTDNISWTPDDHPLGIVLDRLNDNLQWKHSTVFPKYMDGPTDEEQVFESVRPQKTYPITLPVTSEPSYEKTFIATKFEFDYTVRNDDHRRWLNLLLDCGFGWKNTLGFGFANKVEQ